MASVKKLESSVNYWMNQYEGAKRKLVDLRVEIDHLKEVIKLKDEIIEALKNYRTPPTKDPA